MKLDSKSKKKLVLISVVTLLLVAAMGYVIYSFMQPKSGNYAKDIARPLEEALISAGATKMCETGDKGRGPDNLMPWYEAYFVLDKTRPEAEKLIFSLAKENSYNLTHATPQDKGPINVGDDHIGNWYYDYSRDNTFSDLQAGNIKLAFILKNNEKIELSHISCGTRDKVTIYSYDAKTAISISVALPEFKR